jgi:predicted acetyltransferase
MELVWPSPQYLPGYIAALERGWSADNERGAVAGQEELVKIKADPVAFVESMVDREAKGGPVKLPDGSVVPRLPGYRRWLWDGEFCGNIGFRWQPGTTALPPHCLGHIGYAVVPWKQRRGYATLALRLLLPAAKAEGMAFVEITTDPDNVASQRVILSNGGTLVQRFTNPPQFGGRPGLRYRIVLE